MESDAVAALRAELGGSAPRGLLEALSEEEIAALAASLARARARQAAELETGIRRALGYVPAPLRATVRRIVFVDGQPEDEDPA